VSEVEFVVVGLPLLDSHEQVVVAVVLTVRDGVTLVRRRS